MIPLICPNYNQLTYTQNLCLWFRFYYPDNPIYIVDNGSDYPKLLEWYDVVEKTARINIRRFTQNEFIPNLRQFLDVMKFEYYVVSDPDIMPHPATPPNFLEYFKAVVDGGYHRCGFGLIYDDIPEWNPKKGWIQGDQKLMLNDTVDVHGFTAYKAPIDTTFCLYKSANGGWQAPMNGQDWGNCLRLFNAFHLSWYLHKDHVNPEMTHYYNSVKKRDIKQPSAGRNHFQPFTGIHD